MTSIASAFSNFAKMPAQQSEQLDVVKITKLALEIFNEKHIRFDSSDPEIFAIFDRTQLIRVVTNLVKNALQACKELSQPIIKVFVQKQENQIIIEVTDNGVGIEEKNIDKIFEPKFTTKTSGMGLGLAMVKNILQAYNGSITFTSTPNKKTTFRVVFSSK
jgi:signal transduction histidine kinase